MASRQDVDDGEYRIRFVFDDAVVSVSLALGVTFGEIARMQEELALYRTGNPISVDATLSSATRNSTIPIAEAVAMIERRTATIQ